MRRMKPRQRLEGIMRLDTNTMTGVAPEPALVVLRPFNPAQSIARGRELAARQASHAEFAAAIGEQPHMFAGYLGRNQRTIFDEKGHANGELEAGDVLLPYREMVAAVEAGDFVMMKPH